MNVRETRGTHACRTLLGWIVVAVAWLGSCSLPGETPQAPAAQVRRASSMLASPVAARFSPPSAAYETAPSESGATLAFGPGGGRQGDAHGKGNEEGDALDWFTMTMSAIAGLVLFIFGVSQLAQGLGELNSERMRRWTARFTSNRLAGVATGFVATTLLESSSVTIIMVIAMVSGGVLTFIQSLGVVLGSNIGTAVGAQIIALDVERYVPLLMLTGLVLLFLRKSRPVCKLGVVVLGFGLMFYGLGAIDEAMKPLRDHGPFMHAMQAMGQNPVIGAALGAVFTMIIQSSSATVAIVITLAGSGLISLPAGIAIMLGAEIGTCSDTLLASIGRGRPALRTALFHLVFNLVTACIGVALAPQFVRLVDALSGDAGVGRKVAHAQMIFNCAGVAAVLPFLGPISRFLERVIPDSERDRAKAEPAPAPAQ